MKIETGAKIQGIATLWRVNAETGEKTFIVDEKNLVMDNVLNYLADGNSGVAYANMLASLKVGDGNNPNSIDSAVPIFTQAGNTLSSSVNFFTPGMVNAIFKWGVGSAGNEIYITGYTDAQNVTVNTAAAVAVPDVGTVWFVQQTTLQNYLLSGTGVVTGPGMTYLDNVVTYTCVQSFNRQVAPYNVNEVGYANAGGAGIFGRIVLGATAVIPPTDFLVVQVQLVVTISPETITAFPNVGTNVDTTGQFAWNFIGISTLDANQNVGALNSPVMDGGGGIRLCFHDVNDLALAVSMSSGPATVGSSGYQVDLGVMVQAGNPVGVGRSTTNFSTGTAGFTCYFIIIGGPDVNTNFLQGLIQLTTPFVVPAGTFQGQISYQKTFSRTLVN